MAGEVLFAVEEFGEVVVVAPVGAEGGGAGVGVFGAAEVGPHI